MRISTLGLLLSVLVASTAHAQWQQPLQPPPPLPQPQPQPQPLQPPPPFQPPPQQWQPSTTPPPQTSSSEGRGLEWFWGRAEVGVSYMHLSLDESALALSPAKASSAGAVFGAAAGARLLFFTVGARFRFHQLADYNLWQLGGMLGVHLPYGNWDFGGDLYMGYAAVGAFAASNPPTSPSGAHFGIEGGADYYFLKWFSAGATIDLEFLFLGRAGKNGVGLGTALVPHVAIHF